MNKAPVFFMAVLTAVVFTGFGSAAADFHPVSRSLFQEWIDWANATIDHYKDTIAALQTENAQLREEIKVLEQEKILTVAESNPIIKGLIAGEIKYYVEPLPSWSTYNVELFDDYLEGRQEEGVKLKRTYDKNSADMHITWVKDYGQHLGVAYGNTVATVGLGNSSCGDWQHFDDWTVTRTAWHEIGHVLGYGHSDDPGNVMYPTFPPKYNKDADIKSTLPAHWHHSIGFCNDGSQYFTITTNPENLPQEKEEGFSIAVLDGKTDTKRFQSEGGQYYPDCSDPSKNWITYSNTCSVSADARLVIYNKESYPIKIEGHIADKNKHGQVDMNWDDDAYEYDSEYLQYIRDKFGVQ